MTHSIARRLPQVVDDDVRTEVRAMKWPTFAILAGLLTTLPDAGIAQGSGEDRVASPIDSVGSSESMPVDDYAGVRTLRHGLYGARRSRREALPVTLTDRSECDSDLNGALYGTLAGAAPGLLAVVTSPAGEARMIPTILTFAGGFVGFWIGLAIDSLDCEDDEPE